MVTSTVAMVTDVVLVDNKLPNFPIVTVTLIADKSLYIFVRSLGSHGDDIKGA